MRACERAKLRARDDSYVARARHTNLWGPSLPPSVLRLTFKALEVLTDDMRSLGGADDFSMVVSCSRVCFVRVLCVLALLDRALGPSAFWPAVFRIACVLRGRRESEPPPQSPYQLKAGLAGTKDEQKIRKVYKYSTSGVY